MPTPGTIKDKMRINEARFIDIIFHQANLRLTCISTESVQALRGYLKQVPHHDEPSGCILAFA